MLTTKIFIKLSAVVFAALCSFSLWHNVLVPRCGQTSNTEKFVTFKTVSVMSEFPPKSVTAAEQFHQIGENEIYIHSAFLDNRFPNTTYVRMFGMQPKGLSVPIHCRFRNSSGTYDIPPERIYPIYPWWPSEKLHLHAHYYGCQLPHSRGVGEQQQLKDIALVTKDSREETKIPLFSVNGYRDNVFQAPPSLLGTQRQHATIGICVKAIWGRVNAFRLVEWIETNKLAGVTKFIFYDVATTGPARQVINYYSRLGIADVIQYSYAITMAYLTKDDAFQKHLYKSSMALEQSFLVSINDCLYRYQDRYRFLLVTDLDELLIPTADETLGAMLNRATDIHTTASSYTFNTAWHFEEFGQSDYNSPPYLQFQKFARRSKVMKTQPKSIFIADRFISANWHGVVMMPWKLGTELQGNVYLTDEGFGFVHHYRTCSEKYRVETCNDMIKSARTDEVVPRYKMAVQQKVKDVLLTLKLIT